MKSLVLLLIGINFFIQAKSQDLLQSVSLSDCSGAVKVSVLGAYSFTFAGSNGLENDLLAYEKSLNIKEVNSVWFRYRAKSSGLFNLKANVEGSKYDFISFVIDEEDYCSSLHKGTLIPNKVLKGQYSKEMTINSQTLESVNLESGQMILLFFQIDPKLKDKLNVNFDFISDVAQDQALVPSKLVDVRTTKTSPFLNLQIRNIETGLPVEVDLTFTSIKEKPLILHASDLKMDILKNQRYYVKVDAEGFFFEDVDLILIQGQQKDVIVNLRPLKSGNSIQLQDIEFIAGTADFLSSSEMKLKRLKDFMALNSEVQVEIEGHVNGDSDNNGSKGQSLSQKRAERVKEYLILAGIDKKRLTAKGYGSSKPIYEKPKSSGEEQLNRRVEIRVL